MYDIINEKTKLDGAGPWNTDITTFTGNTLLDLWANAPSDKVEIIRVLQKDGAVPTTNNQMCCVKAGTGATITAAKHLQRCKDGKAYDAALDKDIHSLTIPAGSYIFKFTGAGFAANGTRMTAANTDRKSCDCDCLTVPVQAATPPATVTKAVTGLPCPLPASFMWNGATTTLSAFIADVKAQVAGAAYSAATCSFTATAGSSFPPLEVSAAVVIPPTPPITQAITPCPTTFPMVWDYDGASYPTLGAFVNAYKAAMLPVAVTFTAPCTFIAPAGTVFLPTALSDVPVALPVYCPSRRLPNGGFGFDAADSKDPAATEVLNACAGDVFYRPIYIYPTPRLGATMPVICDTGLLGYAINQSDCAPACPCPEMNVTVNNAAPVNNVSVAAPTVNVAPAVNNFAPTTTVAAPVVNNAFSPTTNVAAPSITLPAPTVASQTFDSQNRLVTTMTDGTVYTSTLATC
jgi:hypothetical protein